VNAKVKKRDVLFRLDI